MGEMPLDNWNEIRPTMRVDFDIDVRGALAELGVGPGELVVTGVSGGSDSMALACALHAGGQPIFVGHVNYGLRGSASDADEQLVVAWCESNGVPFAVLSTDVMEVAAVRGKGMQEAARHLRYGWFAELARKQGAAFVATGHHADDQAETVLLQLIRSGNPLATAGIPGRRSLDRGADGDSSRHAAGDELMLVRPLLRWTKSALQGALRAGGVEWRDDATNESDAYLRNRIRTEVMPVLEAVREGTAGHLANWAARMAGLRDFIEDAQADAMARCWNGTELDLEAWRAEPLATELLYQVAAEWGLSAAAVPELSALARENVRTGARLISGSSLVIRERKILHFQAPKINQGAPVEDIAAIIHRPLGEAWLEIDNPKRLTGAFTPTPEDWSTVTTNQCWLDIDAVKWPLNVRPWKNGDTIAPHGMKGSQKVSDLLTQSKVPNHARSAVCVLESADGKVIWVLGVRTSRHASIGKTTIRPWCLTLHTES